MNKLLTLLMFFAIGFLNAQQDSLEMTTLGRYTYFSNANDVWGWHDGSGNEYAIVGLETGVSIVDVTNPSSLEEEIYIPGAFSIWRDMKSYNNYSYTVHDNFTGSTDGILIVDMSTIEDTTPTFYRYTPIIDYNGSNVTFQNAHNVYIDENGILYCFGSNIGVGGALLFDLNVDPISPPLIGIYDQYYLHDGVARGDTLWGAAILDGFFVVLDITNKQSISQMAQQGTPSSFTHNIWFSDDNQRVFTTDERSAAYIAEYDVSDLNNITELDRVQTSFGTDVIPHNVHFHNNFLVNSYYTSGIQILDVSQPGIMVETAYYDTSPLSGDGFSGAWGAFPYLPSGYILATDRAEGLFVLSSTYPRGCYLNLNVTDSVTGSNLLGADVTVTGNLDLTGSTDIFGNHKAGQADTGSYSVVVTKPGYQSKTFQINMQRGVVTAKQVKMIPEGFSINEFNASVGIYVYPNPSKGEFNIELSKSSHKQIDIKVYDLNGILVSSKVFNASEETSTLNLDVPNGIYLLDVYGDNDHLGRRKILVFK